MQQSRIASNVASIVGAERRPPVHHWHAKGYAISIASSLVMAVCIGIFFLGMAGWKPEPSWQTFADFTVTWLLLTYIWIQLGSLLLVGAGTKNQMWIDALTSIVPLFLIFYVVLQHLAGYIELSHVPVEDGLGHRLYHAARCRHRSRRLGDAEPPDRRCRGGRRRRGMTRRSRA